MKGTIIGYEARGPNDLPVVMVEFAHMPADTSIPLNKDVELDLNES